MLEGDGGHIKELYRRGQAHEQLGDDRLGLAMKDYTRLLHMERANKALITVDLYFCPLRRVRKTENVLVRHDAAALGASRAGLRRRGNSPKLRRWPCVGMPRAARRRGGW